MTHDQPHIEDFWEDKTPAAGLKPGAVIIDPEQTDLDNYPVIRVRTVSEIDADGMVTIGGNRGSDLSCQVRIAADWPVEFWTSERAAFEAFLVATEHARLFGAV